MTMVLSQSVYELAQATSAEGASGLENMNLFSSDCGWHCAGVNGILAKSAAQPTSK